MKRLLATLVCVLASQAATAQESSAVAPAEVSSTATTADANPEVKPAAKQPLRADRLDLETTVVTGNRELPKVLYIVPWKRAELGELPAQPFNTLLDEVLQPVDRDVFRREVKYFHAIQSGADATPAAPGTR